MLRAITTKQRRLKLESLQPFSNTLVPKTPCGIALNHGNNFADHKTIWQLL
jgi:hypothetical protein